MNTAPDDLSNLIEGFELEGLEIIAVKEATALPETGATSFSSFCVSCSSCDSCSGS